MLPRIGDQKAGRLIRHFRRIKKPGSFLVGRYLLHLNWILLAGAICGAMTSTPGLGAAIDATGSEDCGAGYGATYPFALLCMVLFTKLLVSTFR